MQRQCIACVASVLQVVTGASRQERIKAYAEAVRHENKQYVALAPEDRRQVLRVFRV